MKNELYWGFMLKLSHHMWQDETSPAAGWYMEPYYNENNNTDVDTWDNTVRYLKERRFNLVLIDVGDGVRYESHPEISAPDAWDKDFLKKKLDEMRAAGLVPVPKLNFSTCHDTWLKQYRRMVSTTTYYKVCADVIREVCEAFGNPPLFHLGFDEEIPEYQHGYDMCIVRNGDLWWHDLFYLAGECEKHGSRPWIWSDYLWHHEEAFLKNMPKSIMQSNWYYGTIKDVDPTTQRYREIHGYELLDQHGYDQIPTGSTWNCIHNMSQTVGLGKDRLSPELLKGYLIAPWRFTYASERFRLMDDAERLYLARQKWYPETLPADLPKIVY